MADQVLILGGRGRIGSSVAQDIATHTQAKITITSRKPAAGMVVSERLGSQVDFLALDLADKDKLRSAIASSQLVIHCAGPFHHRDARVLKTCIEEGVNYLDVSDHPSFTRKAQAYSHEATEAGVTAIINTGIFPGISNSMVRHDVEQLDEAKRIHLSYVVSGSGGAGVTVMRTTFLGLQSPFEAWIDGQWQLVKPYSDREVVEFPNPYGRLGVYWFNMPEAFTLAETFPVETVVTKFGTFPNLYNDLTWSVAHWWPSSWLQQHAVIEFLAHVSHQMTAISDRFTGIGVAIRSEITGYKDGQAACYCSTLVHENTAVASGCGTGSLAQSILDGKLQKPGVWPVEQALPTDMFELMMQSREIKINREWLP